jgi:hypothetical protein
MWLSSHLAKNISLRDLVETAFIDSDVPARKGAYRDRHGRWAWDRLAGLFGQFKSDWPSRLLLSHRCTVRRVSARSDILDLDRDDVTATELVVDRQIEHGEVPSAAFDLVRIDQTCLGRSGGFAPVTLPFQGTRLSGVRLHSLDPAWPYSSVTEARSMCLGHWNQVSFRATADFASGSMASDRQRLTQSEHWGVNVGVPLCR